MGVIYGIDIVFIHLRQYFLRCKNVQKSDAVSKVNKRSYYWNLYENQI